MNNLVVAHFLDGRILKGNSLDVDANKPVCHIRPPEGKAEEVKLAKLKALFFVRSLEGNAKHEEAGDVESGDLRVAGSAPISCRFSDGEVINGLTNRFPPIKPFFFLVPVDTRSNNIRILVNRSAVMKMENRHIAKQPASK